MSEPVRAYNHVDDECVRCQAMLTMRVHPDPRPGRPQDERISYVCTECHFEVRVHRFVNRLEPLHSVGRQPGGSG
jgi:hypothetical protein